MPTYEYECEKCGRFEMLAYDIKDKLCPQCGTLAKRKLSSFTFKFKGYPKFIDRIDDYHKRQVDKGEIPTMPHPQEVL